MANTVNGARTAPPSPSVASRSACVGIRGSVLGVTRIGSRAGLVALGVLGAIVLAIVYGLSTSGNHRTAATLAAQTPQILATTGPLFPDFPGAKPAATPAPQPRRAVQPRARAATVPALPEAPVAAALTRAPEVPDIRPLTAQQAQTVTAPAAIDPAIVLKRERERQALALADAARHAAIMVGTPGNVNAGAANTAAAAASQAAAAPVQVAAAAAPGAPGTADPNEDPAVASQRAKAEFLSLQKSTTASDYLTTPRQGAISPYEVQAGSIIPAILVTGINSDLPGQMIGQVSQNVYDSKTGTFVLIPAGSKLVGRYDSQVTNGQSRVLVAWQRIIFPDSSFIDIGGMSGTDTAGYSGFTGKVDDHSGKLFRNAILFSLIGAGATLLQPRTAIAALTPVGMVQAPTVGAQIAGQVGTQISQVASQATSKGLQQQPTIEVRPGYLFNIMVDRDLVLPGPYTK